MIGIAKYIDYIIIENKIRKYNSYDFDHKWNMFG